MATSRVIVLDGTEYAVTDVARLAGLEAMEQRAIYFRDFPSQVPYPHPDWSRATLEAAVARSILEDV